MIEITEEALRQQGVRVTDYVREVVTCGDTPGVLSGAALKGKAKLYGASYARTRDRVARAVAAVTDRAVLSGMALQRGRWVRVWVDGETGEPVTLGLTSEEDAAA